MSLPELPDLSTVLAESEPEPSWASQARDEDGRFGPQVIDPIAGHRIIWDD